MDCCCLRVLDDFVGSRRQFVLSTTGGGRWHRSTVGLCGWRWISLAVGGSVRWIVVGRGWRWIPLVAAGGGGLCRPQVLGDFVSRGRRLFSASTGSGGLWWIKLVAGGSTRWIVASRGRQSILLVTAGYGGLCRPRVLVNFVSNGQQLVLSAASGSWFRRAAVD